MYNSIHRDYSGKCLFHYILLEYLCEYIEGLPNAGDDSLEVSLVSLDQLDDIDIMPGTRKFIKKMAKKEGEEFV